MLTCLWTLLKTYLRNCGWLSLTASVLCSVSFCSLRPLCGIYDGQAEPPATPTRRPGQGLRRPRGSSTPPAVRRRSPGRGSDTCACADDQVLSRLCPVSRPSAPSAGPRPRGGLKWCTDAHNAASTASTLVAPVLRTASPGIPTTPHADLALPTSYPAHSPPGTPPARLHSYLQSTPSPSSRCLVFSPPYALLSYSPALNAPPHFWGVPGRDTTAPYGLALIPTNPPHHHPHWHTSLPTCRLAITFYTHWTCTSNAGATLPPASVPPTRRDLRAACSVTHLKILTALPCAMLPYLPPMSIP